MENKQEVVQSVVAEAVEIKEKGLLERFFGSLSRTGDGTKMTDYILLDILAPTIKNVIVDTITSGINMALYGTPMGSGMNRTNSYFQPNHRSSAPWDPVQGGYNNSVPRPDNRYNMNNQYNGIHQNQQQYTPVNTRQYYLQTRQDAELVLNEMRNILMNQGIVTYATYLQLMNMPADAYTHNNLGWADLGMAKVVTNRNGHYIDLPNPISL